ncbi:MAG: cellulase family glycosylhydrolase [Spirochaetes bacterium]|nr:cellulase family glycosylhydrolase [Spirochaetota bacterium]
MKSNRFTKRSAPVLRYVAALALAAALVFPAMTPTDQKGWFPFPIPDLAGPETANAALDLSFLSPEPAGRHGFLRPKGETLVDDRGVAVRLFGVNITDYHPLMPKEVAGPCAQRLKQLGINAVRLHYFDWDVEPSGILNKDRQTLNAAKLDQLDTLIHQLAQNGVWVDLNLHVARGYADMPPGWDRMGKGLDFIHEPYIQSQMRYARDLLSHVNPYTKKRLADDPAIAIIEINNENTALREWNRWAALPPAFSDPLKAKWNEWLKKKYGTTQKLLASWGQGAPLGREELLRNADLAGGTQEWNYEKNGGGEGALECLDGQGGKEFRWTVTKAGPATFSHQLQQKSVPVVDGQSYTLTFKARRVGGGPVAVDLMMQEAPWRTIAGGLCDPGDANAVQTITFEIANPLGKALRLNLNCRNQPGVYYFSAFSLRTGTPPALDPSQRFEDGTIALLGSRFSKNQAKDYVDFLLDQEIDYVTRMKALLTGELGCRQVIYCTQVNYGGGAGAVREGRTGDATDAHCYPDHPSSVGRQIRNIPLTGAGAESLSALAGNRLAGKPFFVTEFDLNPPNDHTAQVFPMLGLLASFQDWSGVFDYAWYNFGTGPGTNFLKSPWVTVGDTAQMAFVPPAALLFRLGLVKPAAHRLFLDVPQATAAAMTAKSAAGWDAPSWDGAGVSAGTPWNRSVAMRLLPGAGPVVASEKSAQGLRGLIESDSGEIAFDRRQEGRETLTVNAPACRFASGIVADRSFKLADATLSFQGPLHRSFGQAMVVSVDGKPVSESAKVLVVVACKAEGTGQAYDPERRSATWGKAPMLSYPVRARIELPGAWTVQVLDGGGKVKATREAKDGVLAVDPADQTMWYLMTRPAKP